MRKQIIAEVDINDYVIIKNDAAKQGNRIPKHIGIVFKYYADMIRRERNGKS